MPIGRKSVGLVGGAIGSVPRLVTNGGGPLRGQVFVSLGRDTQSARSEPAPGSGIVDALIGPVPTDQVWLVERIAVTSDSGAPTIASVYTGAVDSANLVDRTASGNADIADEVQPIFVAGGQLLIVRWVGMTAGARGTVRLQYQPGTYQFVDVE